MERKKVQRGLYLGRPQLEKKRRWPGRTFSLELGAPKSRKWVRISYLSIVEGKLGP